jgi:hypothetical protein
MGRLRVSFQLAKTRLNDIFIILESAIPLDAFDLLRRRFFVGCLPFNVLFFGSQTGILVDI